MRGVCVVDVKKAESNGGRKTERATNRNQGKISRNPR